MVFSVLWESNICNNPNNIFDSVVIAKCVLITEQDNKFKEKEQSVANTTP